MARPFDDDRVRSGMERQLEGRWALLGEGAGHLGWKAGFGSEEALERFGIDGPLVGYLTDRTRLGNGEDVSIDGWANARVETEMYVRFGRDLAGGSGAEAVRASISALGPAIEIVDIDPPPEDVEEILAGNIFHRGVILGEADPGRKGADISGLHAEIAVDGTIHPAPDDLETATGRLVDVVGWVAETLADAGLSVKAGDVLITGSVVPPVPVAPGTDVRYRLDPLPALSVRFS